VDARERGEAEPAYRRLGGQEQRRRTVGDRTGDTSGQAAALSEEQRDLAVDIGRAAKSFSSTVVTVEPGQRRLRLFYGISAYRVGDREFEFSVIGPLPSFVIQAGGSIGVVAALPRNTTVVKAEGLFNPTDPNSVVPPSNAMLGGRPVWGWFWQNDPLFRIRYRY
jgi:hypothetical protein